MNNTKPPSEAKSSERYRKLCEGIIDNEHCVSQEVKMAWQEQDEFYLPLLAQRDDEILALSKENEDLRNALKDIYEDIEYDPSVGRALLPKITSVLAPHQPAPIRKEGEGKEV